VELGVGRDDARTITQGKGGQPARHQFVRVLAKRDVGGIVAEQPAKSLAHVRRARLRHRPLVVDELRRVEPRLLLCVECLVWPRLV
jgi:hypothetical protein